MKYPVLRGQQRLVEVEEEVQSALADVQAGQVRQEVVAHQEAEEDDVVDHVLEVVGEADQSLQALELALQVLA